MHMFRPHGHCPTEIEAKLEGRLPDVGSRQRANGVLSGFFGQGKFHHVGMTAGGRFCRQRDDKTVFPLVPCQGLGTAQQGDIGYAGNRQTRLA